MFWRTLGWWCLLVTIGGQSVAAQTVVSGRVVLSGDTPLPAEAVLEVTVEDESATSSSSRVIGTSRQEQLGRPPFTFVVPYDLQHIYARGHFVVRGRITAAGETLFATAAAPRVLTSGANATVVLTLEPRARQVVDPRTPEPRAAATSREAVPRGTPSSALGRLPASFTGVLGCGGCPRGRSRLDLWPDGIFQFGPDDTTAGGKRWSGRWVLSSDERIVRLAGSEAPVALLAIGSGEALSVLDGDGRPVGAKAQLRRQSGVLFGDQPVSVGAQVLPVVSSLEDREWFLVKIANRNSPMPLPPAGHPTMRFWSTGQISGSAQCTRIAGRFTKNGHALTLPAIAAMGQACGPNAPSSAPFLSALGQVSTYRLLGDWLDLLDRDGHLLVRFEAHATPARASETN